ncbi:MAG TPA: PIN domain-containing protein [Vicinamibacterales bacterium]|nr:PIN domain-containing protein [Vicinamibacterales bacterium]
MTMSAAIVAVDTSCMVAAVCSWHEHHPAAAAEINRRLQRGQRLCVPAPALVETYAVLTRLPPPHRLTAKDAWALIEGNFVTGALLEVLDGGGYVDLLRRAASQDVAGGRTYDAVIGACAREAGATVLLTFNRRHFDPAPPGLQVLEPALA